MTTNSLRGLHEMRNETALYHLAIEKDWSKAEYRVYHLLAELRNIVTNESRPLPASVIAKHVGLTARSVRRALKVLEDDGAIVEVAAHKDVYALPYAIRKQPRARPEPEQPAVSTNGTGPYRNSLPARQDNGTGTHTDDTLPF